MNRLELIREKISEKRNKLDPRITILEPGKNMPDTMTQAKWMVHILRSIYVEHALTHFPEQVQTSIESGDTRSWFALHDGEPVAVSSLIKQDDGSQELGRGASLERGRGTGGILMLLTGLAHLQKPTTPLVSEVRLAKEFKGIPSGIATQIICLGHLGLKPYALIPAFHHGNPDRNEPFAFSTSHTIELHKPMELPGNVRAQKLITETAVSLTKSVTSGLNTKPGKDHKISRGWTLNTNLPFSLIVSDGERNSFDSTLKLAEKNHPFTLIPIEMTATMSSAVIECLNRGFTPCGIDRNPGPNSHPVLLLGKLRKGTLLADMQLVEKNLSSEQQLAMNRIFAGFKQNL